MIVVDGATHFQQDGMGCSGARLHEGRSFQAISARCSTGPESSLTVLDLGEVDVTLKNAEIFGLVLSGESGSANGWWCCWGAPGLPQLPSATPKNPPPPLFVCCFNTFADTSYCSRFN